MYDEIVLREEEYEGFDITLKVDYNPENPREWDNVGNMALFHRRYAVANEEDLSMEDVEKIRKDKSDKYIWFPVYGYDHSIFTIKTSPFSCQWDSGLLGIIYVTRKQALERVYVKAKRVSKKRLENIKNLLQGEVETYNKYLVGDVCGFTVEKDGEHIDSCWGFFSEEDAIEAAKESIYYHIKRELPLFEVQIEKEMQVDHQGLTI